MNWQKLEEIIGESVPNCLKTFLSLCAYDTLASIQNISIESIQDIERHMSTCTDAVQLLDCCHSEIYKNQREFKLLPGHRDFLLSMSSYRKNDFTASQSPEQTSTFPVLQAMILTTNQNMQNNKHHAHYNELIRYFSTYVYLLAGRACYEFLRSNLGLPSTKTVCKLNCGIISDF